MTPQTNIAAPTNSIPCIVPSPVSAVRLAHARIGGALAVPPTLWFARHSFRLVDWGRPSTVTSRTAFRDRCAAKRLRCAPSRYPTPRAGDPRQHFSAWTCRSPGHHRRPIFFRCFSQMISIRGARPDLRYRQHPLEFADHASIARRVAWTVSSSSISSELLDALKDMSLDHAGTLMWARAETSIFIANEES
jgi:hypothetical protein